MPNTGRGEHRRRPISVTAADSSTMLADGIPTLAFSSTSNRITTTGFQYDVAGNQTRALAEDGVTWLNFEYDAANRIRYVKRDDTTLIQGFTYGATNAKLIDYDALGTGRNTFYASVGGTTLVEYTEYAQNIPSWTKSYTYLGDSQLSTITPNGTGGEYTEYNHPDRLGTRMITNQTLGSSYEQVHLPFGTALNAESSGSTGRRFTSYERSARTGLDYAVNRTYDSKQGRFTQVDPIGMSAVSLTAPQTLNLYTYCGNDPINHTDPSGLFWGFLKKLFKWVVAIIAVIVAVLTIVGAPAALAGILAAISASAAAGSSVMNALGYTTAAKVFGWIAIATGIGAGLAAAQANNSLIIKNFASTAEKTTPMWQDFLRGISAAGPISNSFAQGKERKKPKNRSIDHVARVFLSVYNSLSILLDREIGTVICRKRDGTLITGPAVIGEQHGVDPGKCPKGTREVATVHTHGAESGPDYSDESVSPADKTTGNNRSLDNGLTSYIYVGTPSGKYIKFIPASIRDTPRGVTVRLNR